MTNDDGAPPHGSRRRALLEQGRTLAAFIDASPEARAFFDNWAEEDQQSPAATPKGDKPTP